MIGFVAIGLVGLALLTVTLVVDGVLDGIFDAFDLGGDGILSGPVIGAFLAAFGYGAALAAYNGVSVPIASLIGVGAGGTVGLASGLAVRSLLRMKTDESVRSTDLVGTHATVITAIPTVGLGEVSLTHLGQPLKFSARSAGPIAAGAAVRVVSLSSASCVVVSEDLEA